jgi:hypothetical protein
MKSSGRKAGICAALFAAACLCLFAICPAHAQPVTESGSGGSIPDATSEGTNAYNADAGVFTTEIVLSGLGPITSFDSITLDDLQHTYSGDLMFELTHVDTGTTVIFLQRPLKSSATSRGTGPLDYGSPSGVDGDFTFVTDLSSTETSSDSLWNAVALSSDVLGGTYAASANGFTGMKSTSYQPTDLDAFAGESMDGTWELTAIDESIRDTGSFSGWQIQATLDDPAPEPGPAGFFLMGGAIFLFVQRWRKARA